MSAAETSVTDRTTDKNTTLSFPERSHFLDPRGHPRSDTEAPPVEPDTAPAPTEEPATSPNDPDDEPDRITPTTPVEEPPPSVLPRRVKTSCPVFPCNPDGC